MKTQLLQDFNDSRSDQAHTPRPGSGARTEPPAAPAGSAASASPTELEATVVAAGAAAPAPAPLPPETAPAAPAVRPATRPRPAVWQRPQQQVDADATVQFPPPAMPPAAASPPPPPPPLPAEPPPQAQAKIPPADGTQPTAPLPGHARGFAPQPTASGLTPPLSDTTVREWPPNTPASGGDPDWLTERLARDVAVHDRTEWNGRWKTRVLSWGAASVLLALVAGGGFWLYEQSRVEGALVVVANTNPSPEANVLRTGRVAEAQPAPQSAPAAKADNSAAILAPVSALPPATLPAARPVAPDAPGAAAGAGANADTSPFSLTDRTVKPVALGEEPAVQPKRQRSKERRHARPQQEARARIPDAEPSARQRREETLLQCRAHGYDERQCIRRGCEMTRYGFACKG